MIAMITNPTINSISVNPDAAFARMACWTGLRFGCGTVRFIKSDALQLESLAVRCRRIDL